MKNFIFIIVLIGAALLGKSAQAQVQDSKTNIRGVIEPYQLGISYDKTVNLVFPYPIISVDRGSSDVAVRKAIGIDNILQLKAEDENFKPTNLTAVTGEGALYSFLLHYDPEPRHLNLKVADLEIPIQQLAIFEGGLTSEAKLKEASQRIMTKKESIKKLSDKRHDMGLHLKGIYISGDVLYFQIQLDNNTRINYDVELFRSYLTDSKQAKRTARQETPIIPLFIDGNNKRIEGNSSNTVVLAFDKFTIPNKKHMILEMMEQNGGRNLKLKIKNKDILKAKVI